MMQLNRWGLEAVSPLVRQPHEVFTPSTLARLNYVARPSIEDRFVDAARTPGRAIFVFGPPGAGKSSLVDRKLLETYPGHVITPCSPSDSLESLVTNAFDLLAPFRTRQVTTERNETASFELSPIPSGPKFTLGRGVKTSQLQEAAVSGERTISALIRELGRREYCWVLEDAHFLSETAQRDLVGVVRAFSEASREFPYVRLVVLSSNVIPTSHATLTRSEMARLERLSIPAMSADDLQTMLQRGGDLLNVDFADIASALVHAARMDSRLVHYLALELCRTLHLEFTLPSRLYLKDFKLDDWVISAAARLESHGGGT